VLNNNQQFLQKLYSISIKKLTIESPLKSFFRDYPSLDKPEPKRDLYWKINSTSKFWSM